MTDEEVESLIGSLSGVILVWDGNAAIFRTAHVVAPGTLRVLPPDPEDGDDEEGVPRTFTFTSATKSGSGVVFESPTQFGLEIHPLHASIRQDIRDFYEKLSPVPLAQVKELLP